MLNKIKGAVGSAIESTQQVVNTARKVTTVAADAIVDRVVESIPIFSTAGFAKFREELDISFTPIPLDIRLSHFSDDPNDYEVGIDMREIVDALNAGRRARPQIRVYSRHDTGLDRDVLADRMVERFKPLLEEFEKNNEAKRAEVLRQRTEAELQNFAGILILTLGGAVLGPFVWLLVGLAGWEGLKDFPGLIVQTIKTGIYRLFFGSELDQLDAELEDAHRTVRKMMRGMRILPLED